MVCVDCSKNLVRYQKKNVRCSYYTSLFFRIFSQDIPTDVVVAVGEAHFPLHKVTKQLSNLLLRFLSKFPNRLLLTI